MSDEQTTQQETEVEALKRQLGERDQAFAPLKAELEQVKQQLAAKTQTEEQVATLTAALTDATAKYQALLVQSNPDIPADLIKGDSVAELEASLANAKTIVQKVKESIEAQAQATPIPAGAPPRQGVDLSSLSPQEKIILGLQQHDRGK